MTVTVDRPAIDSHPGSLEVRRSPVELFAAAIAFVLPIAAVGNLETGAWALRAAILLISASVGVPILLSETRGPRPLAARAAVAFLIFGTASAVVSSNHTTAIFGLYNQGTGLLFMASLAALWAIGRRVRPEVRPVIESALIGGVLVNVSVALLSSAFDLTTFSPWLEAVDGRASALAGNPVHLAALAVLGLALLVPRFVSAPATWSLPVAATVAAAQISGTRGGIVVIAAIALWAGRRHGVRVAAMLGLLIILGFAIGAVIEASAPGTTATGRADQVGSLSNRPATWLSAWPSVAEHPLLGVGPGQFRTATSTDHPISVARSEGTEKLFSDAHNIFVEYLTTTGLLGLGALLVWLVASMRPARGWLLVGALGILVIGLIEPQSVVSTPLGFLALGVSGSRDRVAELGRRNFVHGLVLACCLGAAVAAASTFLFGEYRVTEAERSLQVATARQGARFLPAWPRTASLLAQVWLLRAARNGHDSADHRQSRAWLLVAVQRDRADPWLWNDLGEFDENLGSRRDAVAEFSTALRLNPTSVRAMNGLARLAHDGCNAELERTWRQRASRIAPAAQSTTLVHAPWQNSTASC